MTSEREQIRAELREAGLRATAPRVAVLLALRSSTRPLSHAEVVEVIDSKDWDQATLFRNLIKLQEHDFARVASSALGVTRFEAIEPGELAHVHPHFACRDCNRVKCVREASLKIPKSGRWKEALQDADLQLVGRCPECREGRGEGAP